MDASGAANGGAGETIITKKQRWYALHREEALLKMRERYNSDPEIIRKREEREKKRAEKEAEAERKRAEREERLKAKLELALATSKKKRAAEEPPGV
jgi:hypothetical protein